MLQRVERVLEGLLKSRALRMEPRVLDIAALCPRKEIVLDMQWVPTLVAGYCRCVVALCLRHPIGR